ncbi:zinc finger protein, putative [Plasmodium knowlesi strain H]|uniref:Zinc finger protein, putative n=3 Tax=Plasmodium knowlesi TaxID=5850 RepID=A0A5K1UP25_PLAKH|nr:zinc finger protein, putative [Plasmodium knowlesi strain H]OTN65610.1 putative Zinc finger protein [Plasmodium knowlesi]CAA9989645.1 zinc finger protein, putative [Plasmodium knowlesi strain H]SBO22751.1 zinc finger protein, putative [Plasmodium knowlesi strain H]SBO23153.1 zinc finger protein, putative [Plasmodium knowlesi strain H]VVS79119.1 zinc finger protein, putative [Plasmodium knowlesi strain H]|eukprot:XP_002260369.1 hypothetical protein, conserved in Plasmodium species [Plasmodium knowlesi strain H]
MYRGRNAALNNRSKHESAKYYDEKNAQGDKGMHVNISYHVRKLFSYCDADILRIEHNLIIYNSLIENIKKNANKIVKKEVEKIIREKEKNDNYSLAEMKEEEYKISNFDLKKVELDFKFIECSLCFELIKFVCIQECNHTYCFLCFYRLLYMQKKEKDENEENNRGANAPRYNTTSSNSAYTNYVNNRNRVGNRNNYGYPDEYGGRRGGASGIGGGGSFVDMTRPTSDQRRDGKEEKYNYEFDKDTMKCPFCKERNGYIFFCLNNFYTYFTYDNLLHTLLEKEDHERCVSYESSQFGELNGSSYHKREDLTGKCAQGGSTPLTESSRSIISINRATLCAQEKVEEEEFRGEPPAVNLGQPPPKVGSQKGMNSFSVTEKGIDGYLPSKEQISSMSKSDIKKVFSSPYDDVIILRNILKKNDDNNANEGNSSAVKKGENMYLFFYYDKYIKRKREKIRYLLNGGVNTEKKYALYGKIFVDTERKVFFEYFYIYSLSTLLTSYVCLLSPCIDYWTQILSKKVEKFKQNHGTDKYFETIYVKNEREILRKKNDSIYDKYQQYGSKLFRIKDEESVLSDDYFRAVDLFTKTCFTNLDNINNINSLKNYCHRKLNDLCRHMNEHGKTYCDICVGNSDNIFLFEYNIFFKRFIKMHVENGEKIGENKFKIRHIYCHFCGFYLYDFDTFMNHINKYHFFCKFCFNKRPSDSKEAPKGDLEEDVVYYDQLHTHVYRDYENLFEHYKKKHHPCLYEQCIFVVFDNKIDLCFHLAEKHEEKGNHKRNKITFSIAGASYNEIRSSAHNGTSGYNAGASSYNTGASSYNAGASSLHNQRLDEEDLAAGSQEPFDVNRHKCIYNFKNFHDAWYFDYFIECKVKDFLNYFGSSEKIFFLYMAKRDMEIILKIFETLSSKKSELYFTQEEIVQLNKTIIEEDFPEDRNNFFHFKIFFDYIVEKIDYLSYNKEDLEKNYLYLFFNIIINRSFILYYSFFYLFLKSKHVRLEKVIEFVSTTAMPIPSGGRSSRGGTNSGTKDYPGNSVNMDKTKQIYHCSHEMTQVKKRIEAEASCGPIELSKYGFLYLVFLFFKVEKHGFDKVFSLVRNISHLCSQTYSQVEKGTKKGDTLSGRDAYSGGTSKSSTLINNSCVANKSNKSVNSNNSSNILIALSTSRGDKAKGEVRNGNTLLGAINMRSSNELSNLEDISQLIKKTMKKKNPNNNIINNLYDKKWDICKKVVLDLLYYIEPNLNLVSFFYLFLSNYFSAYMKDPCINKFINISSENKKKIIKRISNEVDLNSLTSISKNLSSFVNAKALEECLSTGPEYYRIRKEIKVILRKMRSEQTDKGDHQYHRDKLSQDERKQHIRIIEDSRLSANLYDVSLSLRNRFLNIIKSTKVNELYCIYFYVSSLVSSTTPSSSPKAGEEEFPTLKDKSEWVSDRGGIGGIGTSASHSSLTRAGNMSKNGTMNNANMIGKSKATGRNNASLSSMSYKNKVDKNKEIFSNSTRLNLDLEFPSLPEKKQEEIVQAPQKSSTSKKNRTKENASSINSAMATGKAINSHMLTNTLKNKKEAESNSTAQNKNRNSGGTPDFNFANYPLLAGLNVDSNSGKKGKSKSGDTREGAEKDKKSKSTSKEKKSTAKSKSKSNKSDDILKTFSSHEFPSLIPLSSTVDNQKKKSNQSSSNIASVNNMNSKTKSEKQKKKNENKNIDNQFYHPTLSLNNMSYLNVPESNVSYTVKKKNKLKRCNMCTYENTPERTRCELCESPL